MGTKVVVVGGGSTYTPELVDGLCDVEDRMVVDDLVLLDPSEERREVVGALSERILRARGWRGTFATTADPHAALEGARGQAIPPPPENYPDVSRSQINVTFVCRENRCD